MIAATNADLKQAMADIHTTLNPAAIQREIHRITQELLKLTTAKAVAARQPEVPARSQIRKAS